MQQSNMCHYCVCRLVLLANMSRILFTLCVFIALLAPNCSLGAMVYKNQFYDSSVEDIEVTIDIDTTQPLSEVEDHFVSYTIDCGEFDESFQKLNFRFKSFLCLCNYLYYSSF